jgi:hypothetical protein
MTPEHRNCGAGNNRTDKGQGEREGARTAMPKSWRKSAWYTLLVATETT